MKHMLRHLAAGTSICIGLWAQQSLASDNFTIEIENDDIAIQANNASLTELLEELEKRTGIPVNFVAETSERVSLTVGLTTVENAISKITPNHMIVHGTEDGEKIIKELIIIPDDPNSSNDAGNSSFLPSGQPAPAITPEGSALLPQNDQAPEQPIDQPVEQSLEQAGTLPSAGDVEQGATSAVN